MRRRLLRALAMGAATATLSGVLAVGGASAAFAATSTVPQRDDLLSYQLRTPADVVDFGATSSEVLAWRDTVRNYADYRHVIPASTPAPVVQGTVNPYGAGATFQLIDDGTGRIVPRFDAPNAWPYAAGKPPHVSQSDWDACATPTGSLLSGIKTFTRQLRNAQAGGTDCAAVKAGWGAPNPDGLDIAENAPSADTWGYPRVVEVRGVRLTIYKPVWMTAQRSGTGEQAAGYVYPITTLNCLGRAVCSIYNDAKALGPNLATAYTSPASWIDARSPVTGSRNTTGLYPPSYCNAAVPDAYACYAPVERIPVEQLRGDRMAAVQGIGLRVSYTNTTGTQLIDNGSTAPPTSSHVYQAQAFGLPSPLASESEDKPAYVVSTVTTATGGVYKCAATWQVKNGERIPVPCTPTVPSGERIAEWKVGVGRSPTEPGTQVTAAKTTPAYDVLRRDDPECSTKNCVLDLARSGESCFKDPSQCADWKDRPEEFSCTYNGKALPITSCQAYEPTFNSENRDASGGYSPKPGQSSSEPTTVPWKGNGGGGENDCFPTGWAPANPVDWVQRPLECAIGELFGVSEQAARDVEQRTQAAIDGTGIGAIGDNVGQIATLFGSPSGCDGIPFTMTFFEVTVSERLFSTCEEPWTAVAANVRMFISFSLWLAAALASIRYVAAALGFVQLGGTYTEKAADVNARQLDAQYFGDHSPYGGRP